MRAAVGSSFGYVPESYQKGGLRQMFFTMAGGALAGRTGRIIPGRHFRKYSKKRNACLLDILFGECVLRLVIATRFFAPSTLLTATA